MKASTWIAALVLGLVSVTAVANVDKVGQILKQQHEIRRESEVSTGEYARFGSRALGRMHSAQDRIFDLLDDVSTVDQLGPDQKVELFNALEEVKAVISENEDNRQECWRERKVGTTLRTTRCATIAEMRAVREDTRSYLDSPATCSGDCGSGKGLEGSL
ncbi:hypothetical protein [Marilutibacter maris]|uniref:Uncharacterized protein n=1 Tax=Marilutibacter maris TaxID=1605891 RepID=A0A508AZ99_9GAMM|nr:hypothetical protein [Lysobacter maris]KAB8192511.1 hypothetical protein FKV24_007190 [Lysobacter maris]